MSEHLSQKSPRKAKPTFSYAIISMALILFLVGILGTGYFVLQKSINHLKESIEVEVELKDSVSEADIAALKDYLSKNQGIKSFNFVSRNAAVESFEKEIGQDITDIAGFNPLYDAFIIKLNAEFSNEETFKALKKSILAQQGVNNVNYSSVAMDLVGSNTQKVLVITGITAFILLLISLSLIDNTIRLLMFSQRFIVRSMQLIGATKWFIIKPFLQKGLIAGLISAGIAIAALGGLIFFLQNQFDELSLSSDDIWTLTGLAFGIILLGVSISVASTYLSVSKYLRLKLDELY
jgi:cell division transport system permease protein